MNEQQAKNYLMRLSFWDIELGSGTMDELAEDISANHQISQSDAEDRILAAYALS